MPKKVTGLTDTAIKTAKPKGAPYRMSDGDGLFLLITPDGAKKWRWQYPRPVTAIRNTLSFGDYPIATLGEARQARDEAKKLLKQNIDPGEYRKTVKAAGATAEANSFEAVCLEWLESRKSHIEPAQITKALARLKADALPWIGAKPVSAIKAPDILAIMRRIDSRGARYTAHKIRSEIGQVIRYAIATGRAEHDPTPDLRGAIPTPVETHHAAVTKPAEVAALLRAFDAFQGTFPVKCALLLAPMLFVRPGELRKAKWADFDLDRAEWRYFVTKTKTDHIVPLCRQAVVILTELQPLTGQHEYVFPGARDSKKPMSDAAINAALRRMGFDTQTEITGHGFRAMARTILAEELHFQPEIIEHQLAHAVADTLGTAYNRTKFLKQRVEMMQTWGDYLEKIKKIA